MTDTTRTFTVWQPVHSPVSLPRMHLFFFFLKLQRRRVQGVCVDRLPVSEHRCVKKQQTSIKE